MLFRVIRNKIINFLMVIVLENLHISINREEHSLLKDSCWTFKYLPQNLNEKDQWKFQNFGSGSTTEAEYPLIHQTIEQFALRRPHMIAAKHLDNQITYGELNARAEALANEMYARGARSGDYIGVFMERSIEMVIAILATLKLGAAYVPQDIRITPKSCLEKIANAAKLKIILTINKHLTCASDIFLPKSDVIAVDQSHFQDVTPRPIDLVQYYKHELNQSCFVIFTSGTTGDPKGVVVSHKNVGNILFNDPGNLGIKPGDKVAQILNIAFDMAAWEILATLTHGATLLIRGSSIQETASQVDVLIATPTILSGLDASKCTQLKTVAVAGEPCPKPLATLWSKFSRFYNSCGPTEVTIVNTMHHFDPRRKKISIGKPNPNTTVYIIDGNEMPLPIGEIGEMWVGGDCVTMGYLNDPSQTQERYRPDPFLGGNRKMFRTKDLARWTEFGDLEHFGRTDDQVKVKGGFRVELDAVSSVLEEVHGVEQAATVLIDGNLYSFVATVLKYFQPLQDHISQKLPYYYQPEEIIGLQELPKTSRGKTDKRKLKELITEIKRESYV